MRTSRAAVIATACVLVAALLAATPATADAVRWSHLDGRDSGKLASGLSSWVDASNLKRTGDLTPESWWGNDSSWNRYSYVTNNPLLLIDPNGEAQKISYVVAGEDAAAHAVVRVWDDEDPQVDSVYSIYSETLTDDYGYQREPSQVYSLDEVADQYSDHGIEVTEFVLDISTEEATAIADNIAQVYSDSTEFQLGDITGNLTPASCVTAAAEAIQPNLSPLNRIQIPNPANYSTPNVFSPSWGYAVVLRNQGVVQSERKP